MAESKQESIWGIIKEALIQYIKSETNSPGGKVNLIFGILIFGVIFATIISDPLEMILKFINPKVDLGFPWYGSLAMFFAGIVYFRYCVKEIMKVDDLKSNLKIKNN